MSIWFWVAGVAVIGLVVLGFNAYHSHLEDEGYWVPNSMKDVTTAVVVILVLLLIALPRILEALRS